MKSRAPSVAAYLGELPPGRRIALEAVREVILANLDKSGYEEGMNYGMISYFIPHRVFPAGYHVDPRQPLPFAGLASQKNYMSLYLMGLYCGCVPGGGHTAVVRWFHQAYARSGKRLDMGASCIRFRSVEDLALDVIGEAIRRVPARRYLEFYQRSLKASREAGVTGRRVSRKEQGARKRS